MQGGDGDERRATLDNVLKQVDQSLHMLADYRTDLSFLQAELAERFEGGNARESSEQPTLNLAGLDVEMTNEGAATNAGAEDVK